ncbi:arginine decarboxylase 2 [Striga asiatica]|uniref:Arginine decarboxylase 2 n=1 Tax=Striga asiatica TaxID=4170 RepID=A0A5A7PBF8_STRAF|nr:arginine decarboxylase 2 [Striga asiatica]
MTKIALITVLVVEQIFDSHNSLILQNPMVNNPIPSFPNHILIRKAICGLLKLPQRVPVAPPQMRDLRPGNSRIRLATLADRPGTRTRLLRVGNPVPLSNLNVDSIVLFRVGFRVLNRPRRGEQELRVGIRDSVRVGPNFLYFSRDFRDGGALLGDEVLLFLLEVNQRQIRKRKPTIAAQTHNPSRTHKRRPRIEVRLDSSSVRYDGLLPSDIFCSR